MHFQSLVHQCAQQLNDLDALLRFFLMEKTYQVANCTPYRGEQSKLIEPQINYAWQAKAQNYYSINSSKDVIDERTNELSIGTQPTESRSESYV